MGYHAEGSAPIGLHYSGPRTPPVLAALAISGVANRIAISLDNGLTWAQATAPAANWQGAAFSKPLGYAIAVGFTGVVARATTNPLVWSAFAGNLGAIGGSWRRCIWTDVNGGRFVATSTIGGGLGLRVATSPEGSVWTLRPTPVGPGSTAWSQLINLPNGKIIATGGGGASAQPFIVSADGGDTWAYCGALPGGALDNSLRPVAIGSGGESAYLAGDFGFGPPFSDFLTGDGGANITAQQVNPPAPPLGPGGGVTACAINSNVIARGDGTGIYTTGNFGVNYSQVAAGAPFANAQDFVPISGGRFVGVALNGAVLQHLSDRTGVWVATATAIPGDYRFLVALPFL